MLNIIQKIFAGIGRGLMTAFVRIAFRPRIRYTARNRRNCSFGQPVIYVGNHTSHMDGVMTSVIFARSKAHILVAKDWYEKPKFNWFLKNNRCIPMDRYGIETGWIRDSREALKKGDSIIIYPEGRTGKDNEPREFKSGFIMLALMTGAKIVPFAVDGSYDIVFGKRQRVLVGEPTELSREGKGLKPEYMEHESERFRQIVIDMIKELKGE